MYQVEEVKDFNMVTHHYLRAFFAQMSMDRPFAVLKDEEAKEMEELLLPQSLEGPSSMEKIKNDQGFRRGFEEKEATIENFSLSIQENKMMILLSKKTSAAQKNLFDIFDVQEILNIQSLDECSKLMRKLEVSGLCAREGKQWKFLEP